MRNKLNEYIKNIESRVKRIEETITLKINIVANILSFEEQIGFTDTLIIYSRVSNNTFYVGYSELGIDYIGDLRSAAQIEYSS